MRSTTGGTAALLVAFSLMVSACESQPVTSRPSPSPAQSPSTPASPTLAAGLPAGLMVIAVRTKNSNPAEITVSLVDAQGHVANWGAFTAPTIPFTLGCAVIAPPAVRIAAGAVYIATNSGVIYRMGASGPPTDVAHFFVAQNTFWSWAVSPDGHNFIAAIFSTPGLRIGGPPSPADPYVVGGNWTLDVWTNVPGGNATRTFHREFGHTYPSPGPTFITGWDDTGPVATLNSQVCQPKGPPSVEYMGSPLIHLAADGTHVDTVGGSGCIPWDELHDGTTLCGTSDWAAFSVRSRDGAQLWSGSEGARIQEPRLSPDGNGVTVNAEQVKVYERGAPQPATARASGATIDALGWFGNDYIVMVKNGTELGLVPARDVAGFIDLGSMNAVPRCTNCFPPAVWLVGTLP